MDGHFPFLENERMASASTLCPKKTGHILIFLNNSIENRPIIIMFGIQNPEEILCKCF